jgi:uncharacterized protein YaeQ
VALTATLYRFELELSDVDRNVYEQLELRAAQHPSETTRYMLARVLAYCLCYEEGIEFTRGLAAADEPAVWIKDLQGNLRVWIEVGSPAADRLHRASKAVPRVVVFTHNDVESLKKTVRRERVHRLDQIELYAIDPAFLDALATRLERTNRWTLARNDAELYATIADATITTRLERHSFADPE